MVWFQCEDCGENLKKPKLLNHFRICSATKLSCIDCGEIFGQQSVQGHTQCITEAEKYGPKGQGKVSNSTPAKPNKDSKQQPDFDIKVGLSSRPPWFCSLCNTKATSEQTLLLHADGKKHRAKARAFHASKQQPQQKEESARQVKVSDDNLAKTDTVKDVEELKKQESSKNNGADAKAGAENGHFPSKKRKLDGSEDEVGDGEVIQGEGTQQDVAKSKVKKTKKNKTGGKLEESSHSSEDALQKIKWKKLVKSNLKSNPDGVMKMKKVKKVLLKALKESGVTIDEEHLFDMAEKKIKSSSRFNVEGNYVRLAAKD